MALVLGAAPSARHTAARRTPSPAVRRRLRRAHQAAEEGAAVLGEELPEGRASEPGAVGGRALSPSRVSYPAAACCLQAGPPLARWCGGGWAPGGAGRKVL